MANKIQRIPKVLSLDDGIPALLEKLAAQKTLDKKVGKRVTQVDIYNDFLRRGLIKEGMIKKGDPLWLD